MNRKLLGGHVLVFGNGSYWWGISVHRSVHRNPVFAFQKLGRSCMVMVGVRHRIWGDHPYAHKRRRR